MSTRRKESVYQDLHESLGVYFERSIAIVRRYADVIERRYARPALAISAEKFKERPIMMTFLAIFCALSALPVLSFVGISIFVISSILFFATATTILACLVVESIIVCIAICTLCSLVIVAIFVTTLSISIYSMLRFILLVRTGGGSGAMEWAFETRQHFLGTRREDHEYDGSTIAVDHQNPESQVNARNSDPGDQ